MARARNAATLRDMLDFTLHSWDVVEALGLKNPILVGHSMGGMIAAEMAALAPNDVSRLALICPAGLWLDEHPIADIFSLLPFEMPELPVPRPGDGRGADDRRPRPRAIRSSCRTTWSRNARQLGMAGKLLFPIPERGLAERLYRVKAKTVIIWGESDRLIPPIYGPAFAEKIAGAKLVSVPEAGHMVIAEKPGEVMKAVEAVA